MSGNRLQGVGKSKNPRLSLRALFVTALIFGISQGVAAPPTISLLQPLCVVPGTDNSLTVTGEDLAGLTNLWTSFRTEILSAKSGSNSVTFQVHVPREQPLGIGAMRIFGTNGVSNLQLLAVDDRTFIPESGTNTARNTAQRVRIGDVIEGALGETQSKFFQFGGKKNDQVAVEVVAARAGSALDPVVRLVNERGRELAYCDDDPWTAPDSRLRSHLPAAGNYYLELRDIRYQGGPRYRYRLKFSSDVATPLHFLPAETNNKPHFAVGWQEEHEPNDKPETASRISIPQTIRGNLQRTGDRDYFAFQAKADARIAFIGRTRALGTPCDAALRLLNSRGEPVNATNSSGGFEGSITNRFREEGTYFLEVTELNRRGAPDFFYEIDVFEVQPGFALSMATDRLNAVQGGEFELNVTVTRFEFENPITLVLTGLGGDLVLTNQVLPGKTNTFVLHGKVPAELKAGDWRQVQVVGRSESEGRSITRVANTLPALRKLFPQLLFPPEVFSGWIAFGITSSKTKEPAKTEEKDE